MSNNSRIAKFLAAFALYLMVSATIILSVSHAAQPQQTISMLAAQQQYLASSQSVTNAPTLKVQSLSTVYGTYDMIKAVANSPTDKIAIEVSGKIVASGTGSVAYNAGLIGAGSKWIWANDTTHNIVSVGQLIVIARAVPQLTIIHVPNNGIYESKFDRYVQVRVKTIGDQLKAYTNLNGVIAGGYTSYNTIWLEDAGTYNVFAQTDANANYVVTNTPVVTFTIAPLTPTLNLSAPGNSIYDGLTRKISFGVNTLNNQLTATLRINDVNVTTTNTASTYTINGVVGGYYVSVFVNGDANYTPSFLSTFFKISASVLPSLSVQSTSITYGTKDIATSNAILPIDTIAIEANGKILAKGLGSVKYDVGSLAPGNYTISANDLTASLLSTAVQIDVLKKTSLPSKAPVLLVKSNPLTIGGNEIIGIADPKINHVIKLMINGKVVKSGNTWLSYKFNPATAGTYNIMALDTNTSLSNTVFVTVATPSNFIIGINSHMNATAMPISLAANVQYYRTSITFNPATENMVAIENQKYGAQFLGVIGEPMLGVRKTGGINSRVCIQNCNWTLDDWNAVVTNAIKDYPSIKTWEIWDEPFYWQYQSGYMNGSAEHYYEIMKSASIIIHKANPNATVVCFGGAPLYTFGGAFNWYKQAWNYGASKYCNAISVHAYTGANSLVTTATANNWVYTIGLYESFTHTKVWVTETGKQSSQLNSTLGFKYSQQNQDQYLNQVFAAFNRSPYVARVYWYDLYGLDDAPMNKDFGLINYFTYKPTTAWYDFLKMYTKYDVG